MKREDFIFKLYQQKNTVFSTKELSLLFKDLSPDNLKARLNYYVKKGQLKNPRKGIYTKLNYNFFELATKIYTPSYISLETVLQKEGVIFQPYKTVFVVSYLTRKIEVEGREIQYRRIKEEILLNPKGILAKQNYFIAEKERAFLDALYLYKEYFLDNPEALNRKKVFALLEIYRSKTLTKRVKEIFKNA